MDDTICLILLDIVRLPLLSHRHYTVTFSDFKHIEKGVTESLDAQREGLKMVSIKSKPRSNQLRQSCGCDIHAALLVERYLSNAATYDVERCLSNATCLMQPSSTVSNDAAIYDGVRRGEIHVEHNEAASDK